MDRELKDRGVKALEVVGYTVIFSSLQILAVFLVFKISLFEGYRDFYDSYFSFFNHFYDLLIKLFTKILGESILSNPVFYGMFMRMFFVLFLVNLIYFVYRSIEKNVGQEKR